ncbi:NTP transferase domain-containing protein [Candidatus Peregrinibacteria bacterium]|jgi:UDP-N-acetylglucosamine diphosphorylase / glucose-1-phosphate thymidylyltransferase / UDP-N-acetylgalactosamine diphosphorylase / glucosamine-1-phosphate N-acetyltransferase / galactosamine-1-phosphate N-acetyltransferase|nr:NTP transferase domain-containing protein [Candidatus Peregrinibacteria bacterium]MBT7703403.1 NTP transferase domain-containing protein [Candidatus Peregrinibacteria bacterium]
MKVLLLAAGRSQRVKPIADKNFLRFCGKYLIHHQVEALNKAGFNDIILIGGAHNLKQLKTFAKDFQSHHKDCTIKVVEQKDLDAGMAGAVLSTKKQVKKDEPILIVSSNDVVEQEAYKLIFDAAQNEYFESCLLGKKVTEYFPGGYLEVDSQWQIKSIIEKPGKGKEPSDLVNLVLHLHKDSQRLFRYLEEAQSKKDDLYEVALDKMMKSGVKMQAIPYEGYWQPIKYPWHVIEVAKHFFELAPKHIAPSAIIGKRVTISGEVFIEEGAKVFDGATIIGPAYIGRNSVVATNALVRDSYVGEECVIGFASEVARSFVGDHVWTHSNYIGDSIIGSNVSFGAGSVTGNLRFDEANVNVNIKDEKMDSGTPKLGLITGDNIRVGVNTSFMPGIKIGSDCLIGAGLVINQDIPNKSFARGQINLEISPNKMEKLPSRENLKKKL